MVDPIRFLIVMPIMIRRFTLHSWVLTSDQVDHIRLLENNTFGFEDLPNGGDKDYNNVIVQVNLSVNAV